MIKYRFALDAVRLIKNNASQTWIHVENEKKNAMLKCYYLILHMSEKRIAYLANGGYILKSCQWFTYDTINIYFQEVH